MESGQSGGKWSARNIAVLCIVVAVCAVAAVYAWHRWELRGQHRQALGKVIAAQIAEGLAASDAARLAIAAYMARYHVPPPDNTAAGLPLADALGSGHVGGVQVEHGNIVVTFGDRANVEIAGRHIQLAPQRGSDGVLRWKCGSTDIDADWLPVNCR